MGDEVGMHGCSHKVLNARPTPNEEPVTVR